MRKYITFDDLIPAGESSVIEKVLSLTRDICPHLCKKGQFFTYCSYGVSEEAREKLRLRVLDKFVRRNHIDYSRLQSFCTGNYKKCIARKESERATSSTI